MQSVFHSRLRSTVAGLWLVGVALAGFTAPLAWRRTGVVAAQLLSGVHGSKADELHRLGIDPELGVALNLVYSAIASAVFGWLVTRWLRARRL